LISWLVLLLVGLLFGLHMPLLIIIFGGVGLWLGSDRIVESTKSIATKLGISNVLIALTVLSIGTSLPEIFTNVFSGLKVLHGVAEASGIGIGTNIGSDIFQITFILGVTGLIAHIHTTKRILYRDGAMMLSAIIMLIVFSIFFSSNGYFITRIEGAIMLLVYLVYLYFISKSEDAFHKVNNSFKDHKKNHILLDCLLMLFGLGVLLIASKLVVDNALILMDVWQVTGGFIGVLIIGVLTGLPELSTAVTAAFKKSHDISLGTIIGSNITNPLMATGIGAVIAGYSVSPVLFSFDMPFWFLISILALLLIRRKQLTLDRYESSVLIICYVLFVSLRIWLFA